MPRTSLGGFELEVLQAVHKERGHAYGVSIANQIKETTSREVNPSAVYVALERLERKGFLTSKWGEPDAIRGGRRKRLYTVSAPGVRALSAEPAAILIGEPVAVPGMT